MSVKLNIGAGPTELEGYEPVDRKIGKEAYPLSYGDGVASEIYASHVLEHFPHTKVAAVLADWVRVLEPGGRLRIAVPDFEWIARGFLDGKPINVQGYTMGGQVDDNDVHRAIFDRESLTEQFINAKLERIGLWKSVIEDCASLPCSLNLQAFKPISAITKCEGVVACLSAPRFGPVMHMRCSSRAFAKAGIRYCIGQGAYWHQVLSEAIESCLIEPNIKYILTCDYDTVFSCEDVLELYRLMECCEDIHALVPVQSKRQAEQALFGMKDSNGEHVTQVNRDVFAQHVVRIHTGHFGLTMFRADRLRDLPRPWFVGVPSVSTGRWTGEDHLDPDIVFWKDWEKAGNVVFMANRVVVGHLEELVTWPGPDFKPIYQSATDYAKDGIPKGVER